jgi:hypothetical protein
MQPSTGPIALEMAIDKRTAAIGRRGIISHHR